MRDKTKFQEKCSKKFLNDLQEMGLSCDKWDFLDGKKESYYQGDIGSISVWIYEDGACIKKGNNSKMFEDLDYKNEDDLISSFIDNFNQINKQG